MTGEELSALIKDEIGEDARLHAILDRIRDGKANLTDSELYAAITARITAQQMRRNVLSLDKREAAFVGITRERYTDTFTVFSAVQRILDAENGIHIRPKEPGFDTGRARKIGHSLEDQTVPDSTIERRARSATENFCMSHHDDCMRVNAEFRARAGLQSYAIRDGSAKCCDWCADVSGKYPANETPAGFWGRHDNCKCSILYESKRSGRQLLRGTSKKWEQVAPGAGAEPLVRLTHEQAAAIQERNRLTVLTHEQALALQAKNQLSYLTGGVKHGKMFTRAAYPNRRIRSDGNQVVDKATYQKLTRDFIRRGGIIRNDEEAARILEAQHVHAAYLPSLWTIAFSPEPTISEVLEETYHAEQDRKHMFGVELTDEVLLRREIDAQHYLLSLTERYKIPESEVELTKFNLANYERDLEKLLQSQGGVESG